MRPKRFARSRTAARLARSTSSRTRVTRKAGLETQTCRGNTRSVVLRLRYSPPPRGRSTLVRPRLVDDAREALGREVDRRNGRCRYRQDDASCSSYRGEPARSAGTLSELLERLPANGRLVLAGRILPDVLHARLLVQQQAIEIGESDLRFSVANLKHSQRPGVSRRLFSKAPPDGRLWRSFGQASACFAQVEVNCLSHLYT